MPTKKPDYTVEHIRRCDNRLHSGSVAHNLSPQVATVQPVTYTFRVTAELQILELTFAEVGCLGPSHGGGGRLPSDERTRRAVGLARVALVLTDRTFSAGARLTVEVSAGRTRHCATGHGRSVARSCRECAWVPLVGNSAHVVLSGRRV